ncbi:MAG: UDP-N-acetylmuramoyl-L-alanine--D-glutamate ligase [Filifactoraceae bacterium]
MILSDTKIIVVGLGKSGYALLEYLDKRGAEVYVYDLYAKNEDVMVNRFSSNIHISIGENPTGNEDVKMVIVSPGIPMELDFVKRFKERNIELIGEVEFAYRVAKGTFIGITGTNGKTTTTTLVGELFKSCGFDTRVVGNIGRPIIEEVETADEETVFVCELSSFQLETVRDFKCHIATIINITPDHLDRHKTFENYAYFKGRVYNNQTQNDFQIVNFDDAISKAISEQRESKKIYFSVYNTLEHGIYMREGSIYSSISGIEEFIMERSEIFLKGDHNVENVLAAIGIGMAYHLDMNIVKQVLREFKGVEHRLEFVDNIDGVCYINDSKGTNPDASCKAVSSFDSIVLIAGGYDKGSDFSDYLRLYKEKESLLIVMGATAKKLREEAIKQGITNIIEVESMAEAVKVAREKAKPNDTVLLSPACASWGMYPNYEVRGREFKDLVRTLRG